MPTVTGSLTTRVSMLKRRSRAPLEAIASLDCPPADHSRRIACDNRSLVDIDYYVGIGQTAYSQLARSFNIGGGSLTDIYAELAEKFPRFVDVLAEVRKRTDFATPDVGKLYEMWLRTRDEWIEKKLRALGVLVEVDRKAIQ